MEMYISVLIINTFMGIYLLRLFNLPGEVFAALNRLDEAEHWYREALKVKSDHVPAHLTLAKLYAKKVCTTYM